MLKYLKKVIYTFGKHKKMVRNKGREFRNNDLEEFLEENDVNFFNLCCIIINISNIGKNYDIFDLKKDEEYLVSSVQLKKCNSEVWDKLVNK